MSTRATTTATIYGSTAPVNESAPRPDAVAGQNLRGEFSTVSFVPGRRASRRDVRDLLLAAGPLRLTDVAGGLDVSVDEAWSVVRPMLRHGCLSQDEWDRLRL